jgi:hypothetical protein
MKPIGGGWLVAGLVSSAGLLFSACGHPGKARLPQRGADISCFEPSQNSGPSFLNRNISVAYKDRTPSEVARDLRNTYSLPISYVDQPGKQLITLTAKEASVRSLLQSLITRMPGNVCRVIAGHVIIYPDRPEFEAFVEDVDITNKYRAIAARRYIEEDSISLWVRSDQVSAFRAWNLLAV